MENPAAPLFRREGTPFSKVWKKKAPSHPYPIVAYLAEKCKGFACRRSTKPPKKREKPGYPHHPQKPFPLPVDKKDKALQGLARAQEGLSQRFPQSYPPAFAAGPEGERGARRRAESTVSPWSAHCSPCPSASAAAAPVMPPRGVKRKVSPKETAPPAN